MFQKDTSAQENGGKITNAHRKQLQITTVFPNAGKKLEANFNLLARSLVIKYIIKKCPFQSSYTLLLCLKLSINTRNFNCSLKVNLMTYKKNQILFFEGKLFV